MRPEAVAVIVPAHNEAQLLPRCLDSVHAAGSALGGVPVLTVVVADTCWDATGALAAEHGAHVVAVTCRNVGRARAAGVDHALSALSPVLPEEVWLATTDADSVVPRVWLREQLRWARVGYDAVLGTIRLDTGPQPAPHEAVHDRQYFSTLPARPAPWIHPHVHGANLGMTAAAYERAGGFPPIATGEDRHLADRLQATGHRIARTDACPVTTASRLRGRARGGLADLLSTLCHPGQPHRPPSDARERAQPAD